MNKGSCLCGDIEWQVSEPIKMAVNCHCSMCRKAHGSAYAAFVVTDAGDFHWVKGEDKASVYQSSSDGGRAFCPRCGSILPVVMNGMAFVPLGNLDKHVDHPLDSHIFVASKAPWFDITDDAPQYEAYPPGFDKPPVDIGERVPETPGAIGGSCLCGAVRFEFDGPPERMMNCHCSRCRKSRSASFGTQVFVSGDNFRWLAGAERVRSFKVPDAKRFTASFCADCGSKAPTLYAESNLVVIPAGSLDQDPGSRPEAHIFTDSKSPSHDIVDDLPQFERYP